VGCGGLLLCGVCWGGLGLRFLKEIFIRLCLPFFSGLSRGGFGGL